MESHCRHCGGQLPEAGGLFCPFCKKAIVAFDPPTEPTPMEMWAPPPEYSEEKLERDRPRARLLAILVSVTLYLMIFTTEYAHFDRRQQAKLEKAFGREPLGMPPWLFAWSLGTLVCVPFPMVLYHFALVTRQSFRDGLSPLGISGFLYLFGNGSLSAAVEPLEGDLPARARLLRGDRFRLDCLYRGCGNLRGYPERCLSPRMGAAGSSLGREPQDA